MSYLADPRKEELQLLRQLLCADGPVQVTHSTTIAILNRLEQRGEVCRWTDVDAKHAGDITARGRKALRDALAPPDSGRAA